MLASASHLAVGSPCIGAGHSGYATGTDIDGEAWRTPPSMGCDEVVSGSITGALSVSAWAFGDERGGRFSHSVSGGYWGADDGERVGFWGWNRSEQ